MKINIVDGLGIACDEINSVTDCVLLYTSATSRSVMSTVSIHSHDKKARYEVDCYIFHTLLPVAILLFIIAIICYHHAKHRSKQQKF